MRLLLFTTALTIAAFTWAGAEPLDEEFKQADGRIQLYLAYAEFKMGNHQRARRMWEAIDGSEQAEALFNLAILYEQGLGLPANLDQAIDLYTQSALLGSRASAYQLGLLYRNNPAIKNREQSRHWLRQAADAGDSDAARLLDEFHNTHQDPLSEVNRLLSSGRRQQALRLLRQLEQQRDPPAAALRILAWHYEAGSGVPADLEHAADLFERAANLGDAPAQYALSVMYRTGKGRAENAELATLWLNRSAKRGHPPAVKELDSKE